MFSDLKISRFGKEQTNVQVCDQPSSRPWAEALPAHCWLGHPSLHQPFSLVNIDGLVEDDDNVRYEGDGYFYDVNGDAQDRVAHRIPRGCCSGQLFGLGPHRAPIRGEGADAQAPPSTQAPSSSGGGGGAVGGG